MTQQFPPNNHESSIFVGVPVSRPPAAVALSYISSCKGKYFSFPLVFLSLNASHLSSTSGFHQAACPPAARSVAAAALGQPGALRAA